MLVAMYLLRLLALVGRPLDEEVELFDLLIASIRMLVNVPRCEYISHMQLQSISFVLVAGGAPSGGTDIGDGLIIGG